MKYPIFIPSKGRGVLARTPQTLLQSGVEFTLVVEEPGSEIYRKRYGKNRVEVLPTKNKGVAFARSWIKDRAEEMGVQRHWQLDDDIKCFRRRSSGAGFFENCSAKEALESCEMFVDRYSNIGAAGLCHQSFPRTRRMPVYANRQVYTCVLIENDDGLRWRGGCIEDTDYSLQVLSTGRCTLLIAHYVFEVPGTESEPGGASAVEYSGLKRLERIRGLQRNWPRLIGLTRSFGKEKALHSSIWKKFPQRPILVDSKETA